MSANVSYGVPMDVYLGLPAVSASVLKALLERCPQAAWFESWLNADRPDDFSDAADVGTIAHSILLEGGPGKVCVIDPAAHRSKPTKDNPDGAIPTGWTNQAIRAARDAAREAGQIPVLPEDMVAVDAMVDAVRAFIASLKDSEPAIWAAFQPDGGDSEVTITWQDGETPCRIRPDRISTARDLIIDLKTTEKSANPFAWRAYDHVGPAFYRRGCDAAFGTQPEYVFLVVEQLPPYLCSLVGVDPHGFELGSEKVRTALEMWARCVAANDWPGYFPRVAYPEIPVYVDTQWQEQQANGMEFYDTLFGRTDKKVMA